jgi:hypothetical protein
MVLAHSSFATTIATVGIARMLSESELVFEGTVLEARAQVSAKSGWIHTFITFEIKEVIKGKFRRNRLTLRFAGGTVGDRSFKAHGLVMPQVGEHGVYFVETLSRQQVNPLFGWTQGHFLVNEDEEGNEIVQTRSRRNVTDMSFETKVEKMTVSTGTAAGVSTARRAERQPGLTKRAFISRLRERTRAQVDQ